MEFAILGPLEARDGGQTLDLGWAKQQALLAVLLLRANEVVSVERLMEGIWGEFPPPSAPKLVQGYVSRLRKELRAGVLATRAPGYALRVEPGSLDVHEFERLVAEARATQPAQASQLLRQALELWRGPALVDVPLEGFARHEAEGLDERRLTTLIDRIDADLAVGRHAELVPELETLVAQHPLREQLRELLMLALYRSGRQADALQAYQDARHILTDDLGIEPGATLRALEAAILRQDEALALSEPAPAPVPAAVPPPPPAHGPAPPEHDELRPVTVLFADIVGSARLAERLSPDEAHALVGECVANMGRAVEEYGGTVEALLADGICAYFGVPHAHEDDPERAARAGLRILEVVGDYARDVAQAWGISDFEVRVGINTDQTGVGLADRAVTPRGAGADTTDVAARVQAAAEPGTIAVGSETARRLAHRFLFEPMGDVTVEGREGPVEVARLAGSRAPEQVRRLRPLVGREREVGRLETVVSELRAGRGQVLLVVGEPGIGKTRLLAELRSMVGDDATWLEGQCLSYGGLPSWPFIEILRRWLGVDVGEPEVVVRTRARARLPAALLPALGRLLRIRLEREPAGAADETPRAYVAWIESLTRDRPVVVAVEDLHWAHSSSRELAEVLLDLTDQAPLALVATLRQDTSSEGWGLRLRALSDYAHRTTELRLDPLTATEAGQLLATLLPGTMDDTTREEIVARAEGNPLYLEELLRSLVESGGLERQHRTWTTTLRPAHVLPPALENLLVARIDRLPRGPRRLAQIAAVLGREFPVAVLDRVAGAGADDDLRGLLRAEIVRELRRYPELVCAFRHGLLQEAAVATLTPARRRELSARAAAVVEELYADSLDDQLERLAHYHAQSGNSAQARRYLERAAELAAELDAPSRAAELRERAEKLA